MTGRAKLLIGAAFLLAVLTGATTLTFAAVRTGTPARAPVAAKKAQVLVVPDVRGQAYVFAKGILEDAGFAWRVVGGVEGYAVNVVEGQKPAAGTIVADTGAPKIVLTLRRNASYREVGTPESSAPYEATAVVLPGRAAKPKPAARPKVAARAARLMNRVTASPAAKPAAKPRKPVAKPKKPAAKPKPAGAAYRGGKLAARPPAFVEPGAPPEPLNEMPLPDRARLLASWLERHPQMTDAALEHWRYQNAWIVYGARFGWWHGARALEILIRVDRRTQQLWGVGAGSEAQARAALDYVTERSR